MLKLFCFVSFIHPIFAVLSASVTQVRALALRRMLRTEDRRSGQQRMWMLTWSLWPSQMELRCHESLPIQLMVHYGRLDPTRGNWSDTSHMSPKINTFLFSSDTFMVEDAVEAIGFGTFQWKLSILTGLSWVRIPQIPHKLSTFFKFYFCFVFCTYIFWVCLGVLFSQMADAMEMMILSILAPQLHCEWRLPSLEVALLTSVMVQ